MPSEFVEQNPYDLILSKIPQITWDNHGILTSTNPAQQTNIEANTIDYIFTDPPFGANIMYSELNFIWESWLKVFTDNKPEAIENKTQKKSTLDYQSLMLQCFKEYYRILKPGKWMTFEFSNTSAAVWNGIRTALQTAGFVICDITDINKYELLILLGHYQNQEIYQILLEHTNNKQTLIRMGAVEGLCLYGNDEALPILQAMKEKEDDWDLLETIEKSIELLQ